ncbi:MAG: VWA domain-containing protein, partial [Myxococcales bacterium]|nr:VWA domain-containing protein [Myxococcales bacterium]
MRWSASRLVVPLSMLAVGPAHADTFSGARSKDLSEKSHTMEVTLRRDHAELRVTRTVHNGGGSSDQATFHIMMASDTVATGLRTQAEVNGKAHWFVGELMEAEAAAKKYRELTGIGGYYPKDPALLSWRDDGHLALQVFPCPPGADKVVEYTLLAPMRYEAGRYLLDLPAMGTEGLPATATLSAEEGALWVDGAKAPTKLTLDTAHVVEQRLESGVAVAGALAAVPFAAEKALFSYHLDVAPRLSEVPDKARVVIVIDASHSFGAERIAAARSAASAYLSHFDGDDVAVEILTFGRKVEMLGDGFAPVATAQKTLADTVIAPRNGSEIGLVLARAGLDLAAAPAGAARRIVVFTDLMTRSGLEPEHVRSSVPAGATLHIAEVTTGSDGLARDDDDPWAKLPRATGGLLWRGAASTGTETESERRAVFEELARPLRIDGVSLSAGGVG